MSTSISAEMAEEEFNRFVEALDIDVDVEGEDLDELNKIKRVIIRALKSGKMMVNEDGLPVIMATMKDGEEKSFHFYEPTGAVMSEIDKAGKKAGDIARGNRITAALFKMAPVELNNMMYRSYKVFQSVTALFLG